MKRVGEEEEEEDEEEDSPARLKAAPKAFSIWASNFRHPQISHVPCCNSA
jgi:hypothetical protein